MLKNGVRQGDVWIKPIQKEQTEVAGKEIKPENGRVILVRGEATGHHHSVPSNAARAIATAIGIRLIVERATTIDHQEHGSIPLDAGEYIVTQQRELNVDQLGGIMAVKD